SRYTATRLCPCSVAPSRSRRARRVAEKRASGSRLGGRAMRTVISGGTVVTASDTYEADVLVEDEKIAGIGRGLAGDQTIDARGKYVIPGGIDVHTHLDMPFGGTVSSDDFFTGHRAAAFGGTTTHFDFAIQPKGATLRETLDMWQAKAKGKA